MKKFSLTPHQLKAVQLIAGALLVSLGVGLVYWPLGLAAIGAFVIADGLA